MMNVREVATANVVKTLEALRMEVVDKLQVTVLRLERADSTDRDTLARRRTLMLDRLAALDAACDALRNQ
jgi:hypothetical protein